MLAIPTEGNADGKEAVDNLGEHLLHLGVGDVGLVQGVVGHSVRVVVPQREHLVLQADEVDVLVVNLFYL